MQRQAIKEHSRGMRLPFDITAREIGRPGLRVGETPFRSKVGHFKHGERMGHDSQWAGFRRENQGGEQHP